MSVKFIKVRFNLDNPKDREVYDILKEISGQNSFIKNAVLSFHEQKKRESLVESIVAAVRLEFSKAQIVPNAVPFQTIETEDKASAEESMDIADAFLDAL